MASDPVVQKRIAEARPHLPVPRSQAIARLTTHVLPVDRDVRIAEKRA